MDSLRNVKAVILHLSDIHRTPDEAVTNAQILNALKAALDDWNEARRAPDIVVVSGDITQGAEPQEYDEARAFLEGLLNHLKLDRTRLVLVPGNHDVYWPESEEALRTSMHMPTHCDNELISKMDEVFFYPKSEEAYQKRLDNFRTFYKSLIGTEYPRARPKQVTIHIFDNFGLAFAGFNSCDVVDHMRFRPSIHSTAIYEASEALSTIIGTCIAVWHHDLDWRNEGHQDTLKHDCLQQISQRVFRLALCGHMHKPAGQNVQTLGGNPLPVITAGSLCAGPRQRKESVPRQFNIIEVDVDTARVHTRVKDEKSSPWRRDARYISGDACVPWFDVTLPTKRKVKRIGASRTTTDVNVKTPTPFGESMASKMPREEVVLQYVWNEYADAFDCSIPQIVLGPRGSGKTALLLSLTFQGRKSSSRYRDDPTGVLIRLGLMCPMKITDVSAFLNKGWLSKDERRKMFAALIFSLWAKELTDTLELAIPWATNYNLTMPSEQEVAYSLGNIWFNTRDCKTYEDVRERLREIRGEMRAALCEIDDSQRESILRRIGNYPIFHGGLEVLSAVANVLKRYDVFSNTNWFVLFDEVEYLDDWQQDIVYQCLAVAAEGINVKIATLPYSHIHALDRVHPGITEYDDYQELVLAPPAQVAGGEPAQNQGTKLVEIARGIWNNRLHAAALVSAPLETVWPEEDYTAVLASAGASELSSTKALEEGMIDDLPESSRERACRLRNVNPTAFSDQYWRRYQQPFRMRLARKLAAQRIEVPLYWGWSTLLKACDGNCRWFLMLADECWRMFWSVQGIRPLTASEQHCAVMSWAHSIERKCGSFGEHGDILREVTDRMSSALTVSLYQRRSITREATQIRTYKVNSNQGEAIAIGIAYGFLVPDLESADIYSGRYIYPRENIQMRLGFPIAASKSLMLRKGVAVTIPDLTQAVFQWWKES